VHWSYAVRGKKFAYYLDDHHGDGRVAVTFRAAPGEQARLVAADPARFFVPAYMGVHGWAGLRLDTGPVDWDEVERFVTDSHAFVALKPRPVQRTEH
jgi:phosphoribosylglycinamide formyltransferase-1